MADTNPTQAPDTTQRPKVTNENGEEIGCCYLSHLPPYETTQKECVGKAGGQWEPGPCPK